MINQHILLIIISTFKSTFKKSRAKLTKKSRAKNYYLL